MRPYLLAAFEGQGVSDQEKEALALIKDWDLKMEAGSAPAAVFEMVFTRLFNEILADDLGEDLTRGLSAQPLRRRPLPSSGWLAGDSPLVRRPGYSRTRPKDRDEILRRSLRKAILEMEKIQGKRARSRTGPGAKPTPSPLSTLSRASPVILDKLINLGPYPVGRDPCSRSTRPSTGSPSLGNFARPGPGPP